MKKLVFYIERTQHIVYRLIYLYNLFTDLRVGLYNVNL
jgi:hypothetical protein